MTSLSGRRALQLTLGIAAGIPLVSGLAGMLVGPSALPDQDGEVSATLDSEYRFVNAFWLTSAPIIWSAIPQIERRGPLLRLVCAPIVAGGLARLISLRKAGRPHPTMYGAIAIELAAVPALIAWQAAVAKAAQNAEV